MNVIEGKLVGPPNLAQKPNICRPLIVLVILIFVNFGTPLHYLDQSPKNLGSRVALLPGKFLRVRKVFARITEQTL